MASDRRPSIDTESDDCYTTKKTTERKESTHERLLCRLDGIVDRSDSEPISDIDLTLIIDKNGEIARAGLFCCF